MPLRRGAPSLVVVVVLTLAASAQAQTTRCSGNHFHAIDRSAFPGISKERAINLPRRTSGYAPRCLVADSIAGLIQVYFHKHKRFPRSLQVHGARWNAGTWRLRYIKRQFAPGAQYEYAVARHGRETVTMDLTS